MNLARQYLISLTEDLADDQMCQQPANIRNHPAWSIGHIATTMDSAAQLLGEPSALPAGWAEKFGMHSLPTDRRADYPSKVDLLRAFDAQHHRIVARLDVLTPEQFSQPNPSDGFREMAPTVGDAVTFIVTVHTATHLGQISAWRRTQRLSRALPVDKDLPA